MTVFQFYSVPTLENSSPQCSFLFSSALFLSPPSLKASLITHCSSLHMIAKTICVWENDVWINYFQTSASLDVINLIILTSGNIFSPFCLCDIYPRRKWNYCWLIHKCWNMTKKEGRAKTENEFLLQIWSCLWVESAWRKLKEKKATVFVELISTLIYVKDGGFVRGGSRKRTR